IEVWHLGEDELTPGLETLLAELDARCVDGALTPSPWGWRATHHALATYAALHAGFRHVLVLDAETLARRDPSVLFTGHAYAETGALFWSAGAPPPPGWSALANVSLSAERSARATPFAGDRLRVWPALN